MRYLLVAALLLRALPALALGFQNEIPLSAARLAPSRYVVEPQIATNGETYAAAWTDYRSAPGTTYAARILPDGTLLDRVGIRVAPDSQVGAIVWSGQAFLIAYLQQGMVKVRALSPDGVLGEEIDLFGNYVLRNVYKMRMATNGESVLLVTSDATAAVLELDGQERRQISFPWLWARTIGVAAAGSTYLVGAAMHDGDLRTMIVHPNGDFGPTHKLTDSVYSVDVSSDGERFLVAWGRSNLYAQFVTREGAPVEPRLQLTALEPAYIWSHAVTRLVRRADEYVLAYRVFGGAPSDTLRLGPNGEKRGPLLAAAGTPIVDITATNGDGGILTYDQYDPDSVLSAAFFGATVPAPLRNPTPVAQAGQVQRHVRLARIDGGLVSAWQASHTGPELWLSRGPGSTPVRVAKDATLKLADVVVESGAIWVVWTNDEKVFVRRFTPALQPIDADPIVIEELMFAHQFEISVAGGGGSVLVVHHHPDGPYGSQPLEPHIEGHLLRPAATGIDSTLVDVAREEGFDRLPVVTWNGSAFVVAWANATGYYVGLRGGIATNDVYTGYFPDDRILMTRISATGARLDASPIEIARTTHVEHLGIAHGSRGTAVVWQIYQSPRLESRRYTYGALAVANATVANLGGIDTHFGAFAADDGGFLLTRASALGETTFQPEVLALDASLGITATVKLPPMPVEHIAALVSYGKPYDADIIGGAMRTIGYARIATGSYGHTQRIFLRRLTESQRRRVVR